MKHLLLLLTVYIATSFAVEIEQPEQIAKDDLQELKDIQLLMVDVHDALRADRHDKVVQMKEKEIEERLSKIGHDIEAKEKRKENGQKDGKNPNKNPSKSGIPAKIDRTYPWSTDAAWTHLPPETRSSIIQSYSKELPSLWRARISLYFISVQEEESKREAERAEYDRIVNHPRPPRESSEDLTKTPSKAPPDEKENQEKLNKNE